MTTPDLDPAILKKFIEGAGVPYRQNGASYIFTCPRCEKKEKLYIRKRDGRFVCWSCQEEGFRGRAEYALTELTGLSIVQIKEVLYDRAFSSQDEIDFDSFYGNGEEIEEESLGLVPLEWPSGFLTLDHPHSAAGVAYLASRGIPKDVAEVYQIRYVPLERAIVFPAFLEEFLVGWQLRVTYPTKWYDEETGAFGERPKALTSAGFKKDQIWTFQNRLLGSEHAVLCEGPIDAIKAHLCGGNVCSLGKGVSDKQVEIVLRSGVKKVYLGLDPDAVEVTNRLIRDFSSDLETYVMELPPGKKDLGEMSFEEVYEVFLSARRVTSNHLIVYMKGL